MDGNSRCQRCNAPLTGQAVGGLCANCLLNIALEPPGEEVPPLSLLPEVDAPLAASDGSTEQIRVRYFGDYELVEEIARGGMAWFTRRGK